MLIQCFCMEQDVVLEKTSIVMLSFLLMKPRYSINLEEALEPVPHSVSLEEAFKRVAPS